MALRGARPPSGSLFLPSRPICRHCKWPTAIASQTRLKHARREGKAFVDPLSKRQPSKYDYKTAAAEQKWAERAAAIDRGERRNTWEVLSERGFVKDVAGRPDEVARLMKEVRIGAYVGIDPTAPSLHLGHLVPLMALFWLYFEGYHAVTLLGGATAKVGDPSGRTAGRAAIGRARMTENMFKMHVQLKKMWVNAEEMGRRAGYKFEWEHKRALVNNNAWWNKLPFLEVLKRLGGHMRMGPMLSRDSVKIRLGEGTGGGMSFSEFSYPLLQAWDWWELYHSRGVQMQIGGSDQYGNIVTGMEAVKTIRDGRNESEGEGEGEVEETDSASTEASTPQSGGPAHGIPAAWSTEPVGFTTPLLTDRQGNKFGKSAGNAVWLDGVATSPFDLYRYLVGRDDADVERLLKLFTFLPLEAIAETMATHTQDPPKRVAQHRLAFEVSCLVHGVKSAEATRLAHQELHANRSNKVAASDTPSSLSAADAEEAALEARAASVDGPVTVNNAPPPNLQLPRSFVEAGVLPRILHAAGLAASRAEGQRLMSQGGIYVAGNADGRKALNWGALDFTRVQRVFRDDLKRYIIGGKLLILRKGQHNYRLVDVVDDDEWERSGQSYPGEPFKGRVRQMREQIKEYMGMETRRADKAGGAKLAWEEEGAADWEDGDADAQPRLVFPDKPSRSRDRIRELEKQARQKAEQEPV